MADEVKLGHQIEAARGAVAGLDDVTRNNRFVVL
jgi:hypothetical protein